MKYILADLKLSEEAGLKTIGHRKNETLIIFNEKELSLAPSLSHLESLEEKASAIGGTFFSDTGLLTYINNNNIKI